MAKYDAHKHRRRSIRLKGWDYRSEGAYFVTICVRSGKCLLGEVVDGVMVVSDFGRIITEEWQQTLEKRAAYTVGDAFVIMPNHIHFIIWIRRDEAASDFEIEPYAKNRRTKPESLGAIVRSFKSACTRRINQLRDAEGNRFWQRNYYEHIIRNDTALNRIREYIVTNPAKWQDDTLHPNAPVNQFTKSWRDKSP